MDRTDFFCDCKLLDYSQLRFIVCCPTQISQNDFFCDCKPLDYSQLHLFAAMKALFWACTNGFLCCISDSTNGLDYLHYLISCLVFWEFKFIFVVLFEYPLMLQCCIQVWIIGHGFTRSLCQCAPIFVRTVRHVEKSGAQSITSTKKTRR